MLVGDSMDPMCVTVVIFVSVCEGWKQCLRNGIAGYIPDTEPPVSHNGHILVSQDRTSSVSVYIRRSLPSTLARQRLWDCEYRPFLDFICRLFSVSIAEAASTLN